MWQYSGWIDDTGKKLVLEADGPDFTGASDKMMKYRDAYEFKSADLIEATSSVQAADGTWNVFNRGELKRVK